MSKISLTPNASGTGTLTIAAPSTSIDRTLTLPDETGTVLSSASSITQNDGPAFSAYRNTSQSFSNTTYTKVTLNAEEFDTDSCFDSSTNYRFTPTVAGYYVITGNVNLGTAGGGVGKAIIYKNGTYYKFGGSAPFNSGTDTNAHVSAVLYLNGSTDYVELYTWQNSGSSLSPGYAVWVSNFTGALVRKA